jgi:hypothetical protein
MDPSSYNRNSYLQRRHDLNVVLEQIRRSAGLGAALEALIAQQLDAGFIEDDLNTVRRYRICHSEDRSRSFSLQYNPRRAMRHGGSGRTVPPAGAAPVNGGCFLCDENIAWQQRGLELGFDISIDDVPYCCYANPFPLMPAHVTVATRAHMPQGWSALGTEGRATLQVLLSHLLTLAEQLPSFVVFFNGPDAGASIPAHFHFQLFKRVPAHDAFPLERSARRPHSGGGADPALKDYPITVACFDGPHDDIVERAAQWVLARTAEQGNAGAMSVNLMAMHTGGRPHLYVAPRHRSYSYAPGFAGLVGGLEILGELVLSTEQEKQQLDLGHFTYERVSAVLAAVEPPGVRQSA